MSVVMKNNRSKNVLQFATPLRERGPSPITVQIGNERFAIHYQIEELPPAAPMRLAKRAPTKSSLKIFK